MARRAYHRARRRRIAGIGGDETSSVRARDSACRHVRTGARHDVPTRQSRKCRGGSSGPGAAVPRQRWTCRDWVHGQQRPRIGSDTQLQQAATLGPLLITGCSRVRHSDPGSAACLSPVRGRARRPRRSSVWECRRQPDLDVSNPLTYDGISAGAVQGRRPFPTPRGCRCSARGRCRRPRRFCSIRTSSTQTASEDHCLVR